MNGRKTASTITDTELDELYDEISRLRAGESVTTPCAGFPDRCPNPVDVPARSPYHGGGIRCGCGPKKPTPCPACRRADQAGLAPDEQHPHCANRQEQSDA